MGDINKGHNLHIQLEIGKKLELSIEGNAFLTRHNVLTTITLIFVTSSIHVTQAKHQSNSKK